MYRIGILFVLYFGISAGIFAMETADKRFSGQTASKLVERPAATTEFHKQAEQVKINPPVVVQQPVCSYGQHLENGHCVADVVMPPPTLHCPDNTHFVNGECVRNTPLPICNRGQHLENGHCIADIVVLPVPIIYCANDSHLVNGECVRNTPSQPKTSVERSREKPAAFVDKNMPPIQKRVEQARKNMDAPIEKTTNPHAEIDNLRKNKGKVQPCNGGFIPMEEECTPSTAVKPVIATDDFAKRLGIAYCKENPEACGVVSMEKFKAARNEGIAYCKKDPLLCDLYSREQVDAAKKEGVAQCQKFPSLCGLARPEVVATPK
jgi:hypothetical protein